MSEELTVTEFNKRVSEVVSYNDVLCDIAVTGEISECKKSFAGHTYLTLKDANSVLKCTLFKYSASRIPFSIKIGMKIVALGSASYYDKNGSFSFNIKSISPVSEKGEQQIALEKLTVQLMNEGLFDIERKKEIPKYPKTIGVVTSSEGAVIKDIINTASRRFPVNVLLSPATVQGADAPQSIVNAIRLLETQNVDVMIIGRGGGSTDDLYVFNDESVVRAVSNCKIPTISAVGHAKDKSLCDKIADKYADTPTAAAMIATPDRKEEEQKLKNLRKHMNLSLLSVVERMKSRFDSLDQRLSPDKLRSIVKSYVDKYVNTCKCIDLNIDAKVTFARNKLMVFDTKLNLKHLYEKLNQYKNDLDNFQERLNRAVKSKIEVESIKLNSFTEKLSSLNPNMVLSRGYSFITSDQGNVITSINDLFLGTSINIKMKDGTAVAEIKELRLNG
ncbi:MAG: exodeoxyribonuclease VII large subunit [archaeon]|nr:exodeoxyribonuclease VII large subunit [archaeon]